MKMKSNILMGRYELGCLLGRGTFAKVYYAKSLKTGESVAIKIMDKQNILKLGRIEQIKREISVMRLVQHPNVVRLYEVMASKSKIYIVMEYVKGGELFKRVANKGKLKEEEARKYFQQLISAVDFCHSQGVYHRDLKLENLLLDENWILKVTDFGLSALPEQHRQDGLLHTACGTPAYVSPEIINRKGYDGAKADIWSCGVILFVLMAGYLPFHGANLMVMYKKIYKGDYKCPPWFSSEVRRVMFRLLDPEPQTRITVAQLMEVPWFRRGFKHPKSHNDLHAGLFDDIDSAFCSPKPVRLNAFDIISRSLSFSLSGLFNDNAMKEEEESRFTSIQSAPTIMSKLEEAAKIFGFSFNKSKEFKAQLQRFEQVRKGHLCIDAEIFEVTSSVFLVEFRKIAGDTLKYSEFLKQELRPRLKDIISA